MGNTVPKADATKPVRGAKSNVKAVGYLRTSSAANVGEDKDCDKRQRKAIERYAKSAGYVIADDDWYYDAAVSGADNLATRDGWNALMARILSNGVRTVLIEDASRFARDLMAQESGIADLLAAGVTVITAAGDNLTASDDPGRVMIRQVHGAFSQYEKAKIAHRMRSGRQRKIDTEGRCGGRKSHVDTMPGLYDAARKLHRANPKTGKNLSLCKIADQLFALGFKGQNGKPFTAAVVKRIVEAKQ